jgi:capsular polysaccharide biosynthesis protein
LNFSSTEAAKLQDAGFVLLDPAKLNADAQIELFAEAELVAGIHGAGLANILWCKPGTCVVEIFHPRFQPNCYEILSGRLGLEYRAVISEGKARGVYDINYRESHVEVDWAEFWRELGNYEALRL